MVAFVEKLKAMDPAMLIHEPMQEDIHTANDRSTCHYSDALGFTMDFQDQWVACVTYKVGAAHELDPLFDQCFKGVSTQGEVHALLGKPLHSDDTADQYKVGEDMIVGMVYYTLGSDELTAVAFGTKHIFSSRERYPNRWCAVFDALYDLPDE